MLKPISRSFVVAGLPCAVERGAAPPCVARPNLFSGD